MELRQWRSWGRQREAWGQWVRVHDEATLTNCGMVDAESGGPGHAWAGAAGGQLAGR